MTASLFDARYMIAEQLNLHQIIQIFLLLIASNFSVLYLLKKIFREYNSWSELTRKQHC